MSLVFIADILLRLKCLSHKSLKYGNILIQSKWATSWENLFMQYANNKGADQPAQSDQRLCFRCLDSIYNTSTFYTRNFKPLPNLCGRFESTQVANPEDRFSRDCAKIVSRISRRNADKIGQWSPSYTNQSWSFIFIFFYLCVNFYLKHMIINPVFIHWYSQTCKSHLNVFPVILGTNYQISPDDHIPLCINLFIFSVKNDPDTGHFNCYRKLRVMWPVWWRHRDSILQSRESSGIRWTTQGKIRKLWYSPIILFTSLRTQDHYALYSKISPLYLDLFSTRYPRHNVKYGLFRDPRSGNSKINIQMWPDFELARDFLPFLIISSFKAFGLKIKLLTTGTGLFPALKSRYM